MYTNTYMHTYKSIICCRHQRVYHAHREHNIVGSINNPFSVAVFSLFFTILISFHVHDDDDDDVDDVVEINVQ